MPDRNVKTIRDLIFYQYAKIIAKRAFDSIDGKMAKQNHYGFVGKTFLELKSCIKSWSNIIREDWQFVGSQKQCIYCGAKNDIHKEHIVLKSLSIKPECQKCDIIQGIHNQIWACKQCNSLKGTKGLYEFFKIKYPNEKSFMI